MGEDRKDKRRSLAGKLLARGKSGKGGGGRGGEASSSTSSLDRLAFGSHQLSRDAERRQRPAGLLGDAIDEEASVRSDSVGGDDTAGKRAALAALHAQ